MVTARLEEAGRASLVLSQQAFIKTLQGTRGALLAQGRIRIGWVDAVTLAPARIPTRILDRLNA